MRKHLGFMIMTLLLLTVPSLANAWTLKVKVAGGTLGVGGNNVTVSYTYQTGTQGVDEITKTATNTFKGTYSYLYPIGPVTVSAAPGYSSMTLDGVPVVNGLLAPTSGNHTLAVSYATDPSNSGLTLVQAARGGGTIYAENRNHTWTTTGVSGLSAGSYVPVTIAADLDHSITGYLVGGAAGTMPATATGAPGEVLSLSLPADGSTITPQFSLTVSISASLSTPTAGTTGNAVNCTVTASSNDAPNNLRYAFTVTGQASITQPATANASYSFVPSAAGTYYVTATVTTITPGGASFTTPAAIIKVADAQASAIQGCTSCHSSSFPTIVNDYNASVHAASAASTCQACHTADSPHSVGINSINISATTFAVLPGPVAASLGGAGTIFCARCHLGATLDYTTSHAPLPKSSPNCSSCHVTVHNPNPFLGGATTLAFTDGASTTVSTLVTPAPSTDFSGPKGITTDGTDLFVADFASNAIRRVASGVVSTVAGSGSNASLDGTGSNASFSGPAGITTDGSNLYVCDTGGNKIRKVVISSGMVTTIAGSGAGGAADGPGTIATFNTPYGITTDGTNLYVTDIGNHAIRKVVLATGEVSTVESSGYFAGPSGITTDGVQLYVTDQTNNTISVVLATGEIRQLAADASFSTPAGITSDGTNLYVTDWSDNTIRQVVIATGAVSTIAGTGATGSLDGPGTSATFSNPFGITTDGAHLYVTDNGNHVIRKLSSP